MKLLRIDETSKGGKVFADWLREKLFAVGDTTKRTERLASSKAGAYALIDGDIDGSAGGEDALVCGFRLTPGINGDEPVAAVADVEADLFDREGPLAVVCDANGAILVAASVWKSGIALHKGDYCTLLSAVDVANAIERAKCEHADGGNGGEGRHYKG